MAARVPSLHEADMESPKPEESQTRFNTPMSDLDDHRQQASLKARTDTLTAPQAPRSPQLFAERQYAASHHSANTLSPDLLQFNETFREAASKSRDFEHAILDDDKSANSEDIFEHPVAWSPALPRRGTLKRNRNQPSRSRDSSRSSRSTSPANSVDAFADTRRRERANTLGSRAPSEHDLGLQRTISGGTHRRRPTLTNGSICEINPQDDRASFRNPAEEDICFPIVDETSKTSKIDFEELDKFVAGLNKPKTHQNHFPRQKLSFSSHGNRPSIFNDLRAHNLPNITTQAASPLKPGSEIAIDDSDTVLNEKVEANAGSTLAAHGPDELKTNLTEPARFSFFSSELEQTIHAVELGDLLTTGETFRDLFDLPQDSGVWWLNIHNPTEDELHVFQRAFGIHRLTTEDIITHEAREKVELFKQYYFVCFRSFFQVDEKHEDYMEPVNVYMVVFREGVITITYEQSPHAANVRKRIGKLRDYMALTADWICYAMMYVFSYPLVPVG